MEKFIVLAICIAIAVGIGNTSLSGDTNSLKSCISDVMTDTNAEVRSIH